MKPFKERSFSLCYDCGWGEKGVLEHELSFTAMFERLSRTRSPTAAKLWAEAEDGRYDCGGDYHVVDEYDYDEADWCGSDDW